MALSHLLDTTPPRLFTVAACGGLKPTPDGRLRGAYPHLLCSSALPLLVVRSRHTLVDIPAAADLAATAASKVLGQGGGELGLPVPYGFVAEHLPGRSRRASL